jgi:hypothetical protein
MNCAFKDAFFGSNPLSSLIIARQKRNHGNSFNGKYDVVRAKIHHSSKLARGLVRLDHIARCLTMLCFSGLRPLLMADQQRVWSRCTKDVLRLSTCDRCDAQLEFLNGFDSALFLHGSRFVRNISGKSKNADQIDADPCAGGLRKGAWNTQRFGCLDHSSSIGSRYTLGGLAVCCC